LDVTSTLGHDAASNIVRREMQSAFNISWWQRINILALARGALALDLSLFSFPSVCTRERAHAPLSADCCGSGLTSGRHTEEQTTLRALLLLFCPDIVFQQTHAFHHAEIVFSGALSSLLVLEFKRFGARGRRPKVFGIKKSRRMAAEIYYSPFIFIPVLCNAARIASVARLNRFGTFGSGAAATL